MQQSLSSVKRIPSLRRHIYFYAVLFLGANVLTGVWKSAHQAENQATEEIVRIQRVSTEEVKLASNQ